IRVIATTARIKAAPAPAMISFLRRAVEGGAVWGSITRDDAGRISDDPGRMRDEAGSLSAGAGWIRDDGALRADNGSGGGRAARTTAALIVVGDRSGMVRREMIVLPASASGSAGHQGESASITSAADWKRSPGSLAIILEMTSESSAGTSRRSRATAVGSLI